MRVLEQTKQNLTQQNAKLAQLRARLDATQQAMYALQDELATSADAKRKAEILQAINAHADEIFRLELEVNHQTGIDEQAQNQAEDY